MVERIQSPFIVWLGSDHATYKAVITHKKDLHHEFHKVQLDGIHNMRRILYIVQHTYIA